MSTITRFSVRSSGRDLSAVRRPTRPVVATVKVEKPAPAPKKNPEPKTTPQRPDRNSGDVKVERPTDG